MSNQPTKPADLVQRIKELAKECDGMKITANYRDDNMLDEKSIQIEFYNADPQWEFSISRKTNYVGTKPEEKLFDVAVYYEPGAKEILGFSLDPNITKESDCMFFGLTYVENELIGVAAGQSAMTVDRFKELPQEYDMLYAKLRNEVERKCPGIMSLVENSEIKWRE